jgi:hypothetical protein
VVPDAFGEWEPWEPYAAAQEARRLAEGLPQSGSAILAGLIRPMACPVCVNSQYPDGGDGDGIEVGAVCGGNAARE